MVKWSPFATMPEQFAGIREIIKEKNKITRPILTPEEKELIENLLLCSLLSEEEILITYYEDGYLLTNYMTSSLKSRCIIVFHLKNLSAWENFSNWTS
ncbi:MULTISPECIES: YolD-like family protein [unclassified Bacillus (in: firmicutes)]|uniref:YolD-like family protein n=1 Tax=unclassified Bacillus (in: firmicutes) TaxID=185979 RepID=UPI0020D27348|nr:MULTISPECIES: YolD-like family protein [unclassified Bacillus (in: firmicutes)]